MPEQENINDVAGLPDGGFLVTQMADKDRQLYIGSYAGDRMIKMAVPAGQ